MKGDFSNWRDERRHNFAGVLHQQGRVLLDVDWNAQTAITNDWQDTAGQDIIGAGVAAVPASEPNGFKVTAAVVTNQRVNLTVTPGRVWADGLPAQLLGEPDPDSSGDVDRVATYLKPPVQDPAADESTIDAGVRDAVILEVWREEINGFQIPELLIEPALGGPDTTERVNTAFAFRLMRLNPGDTCESIVGSLKDDFSKKGKLAATLQPSSPGTGDCPTPAAGGYTGFEHNLYRIEIADVDAGPPQFKWSQYGGGLVGRGHFDSVKQEVTIKANLQAITNSGLSSFYLEAVERDPDPTIAPLGYWRVTYGAKATLNNDVLTLGATVFGTFPQAADTTFFRLWNDIAPVQNFTANTELPNNVGIFLQFDPPAGGNYVPGDYWTFPVRAGDIANVEPLVGKDPGGGGGIVGVPPKGIHYHRVPLGILTWAADKQSITPPIEDCRHPFQPLTRLATCCTYRVGDGIHSWGDFDKIQDAIDSLPADGGEICVLPGKYSENLTIKGGSSNITIKGCGKRSAIAFKTSDPVIHVIESQNIRIESLAIFAHQNGVGILLDGPALQGREGGTLRDVALEKLYIEAATRSAIEAHIGFSVTIRGCDVEMSDQPSDAPGIFFTGDDSFIEDNIIRVLSADAVQAGGVSGGRTLDTGLFQPAHQGKGGLHIGGTSERVRVAHNLIQGGIFNGITLGTTQTLTGQVGTVDVPGSRGIIDPCNPCRPTDSFQPPPGGGVNTVTTVTSAGDLYEIYIEHNLIYNMGANGIGVVKFFDLSGQDQFISIHRLTIVGNEIRNCLNRPIADITAAMLDSMGYGGISLADVDYLVVRDNVIEDNGPDYVQPICGIFLLHGEGVDISRNRVLNNGARTSEPASSAKPGQRGGINVVYAVAPPLHIDPGAAQELPRFPTQNGVPAIKVHENVVTVPLGQALALAALGPVSVVANQFTTHGVIVSTTSTTFLASTVLIVNLGLSNELYFQLLTFEAVNNGQVQPPGGVSSDENSVTVPQPGLDDVRLGQFLANGNVLFTNNQCVVDLLDTINAAAFSSILVASLDDIAFQDNQCDCDLLSDFIFVHAIILGASVRVIGNRFTEGILNAFFSASTIGVMNTTALNQSTHCLLVSGWPPVQQFNVELITMFNPGACAGSKGLETRGLSRPGG